MPERVIILRDENGKEIPRAKSAPSPVPVPTPTKEFPSLTTFSIATPEGLTEAQKLERLGLVAVLFRRGVISAADAEKCANELFPETAQVRTVERRALVAEAPPDIQLPGDIMFDREEFKRFRSEHPEYWRSRTSRFSATGREVSGVGTVEIGPAGTNSGSSAQSLLDRLRKKDEK